jgi:hypothetical protein
MTMANDLKGISACGITWKVSLYEVTGTRPENSRLDFISEDSEIRFMMTGYPWRFYLCIQERYRDEYMQTRWRIVYNEFIEPDDKGYTFLLGNPRVLIFQSGDRRLAVDFESIYETDDFIIYFDTIKNLNNGGGVVW